MTPIVAVDVESDGLYFGRQAWEIGLIRRDEDGERERSFFLEVDLERAELVGLNVGRFYERHPYGRYLSGRVDTRVEAGWKGPLLHRHAAAEAVARFTHGAHLLTSAPVFDVDVLTRLLVDNNLCPAWDHHVIDVQSQARGYLRGAEAIRWELLSSVELKRQPLLPWRSDDLSRACGVEPPGPQERHTALGDARWVMRWHDRIEQGVPVTEGG